MAYELGIDLGTTYTAAAVHRDGKVEIVTLGNRAASVPSVVFLKEDESILTGDPANRRAVTEPDRVAREFKRRVGDPTPVLVGGTPYSAEALMAKLLRWTVDQVAEREGGPPDAIAVTHPANWGAFKKDLLDQAVRLADLDEVEILTEPEAAAIYYASNARVDVGSVVAVYDLGGGTFDAAVLRKGEEGWEILGRPEGIERLGGIDFDEAIFNHVRQSLDEEFSALDPEDPAVMAAVARIRQESIEAKEALSTDTDASIPVLLPNVQTEVRVTRAEFESMVRPTLQETIGALNRALRSADVALHDVTAVLLVGGSSRIPLVSQLVSEEIGRPVAVDAHPKHAIALGAALAATTPGSAPAAEVGTVEVDAGEDVATPAEGAEPAVETGTEETEESDAPAGPIATEEAAASAPEPGRTPDAAEPVPAAAASAPADEQPPAKTPAAVGTSDDGNGDGERRPPWALIGGVVVGLLVIVGAVVALGGGGDTDGEAQPAAATETTAAENGPGDEGESDGGGTEPPAEPEVTGPAARIDDVRVEDGRYVLDYESIGFTPLVNDAGAYHVHFFWDTLLPQNAGTNGPDPGSWLLWDTPFEVSDAFFDVANQPSGARAICVVLVNNSHEVADVDGDGTVDLDTGGCADLPQA